MPKPSDTHRGLSAALAPLRRLIEGARRAFSADDKPGTAPLDPAHLSAITGTVPEGHFMVCGYDAFDYTWYRVRAFATEEEAREFAQQRLRELEVSQPTHQSGGQKPNGLQDRVFVVLPDGRRYRALPGKYLEPF